MGDRANVRIDDEGYGNRTDKNVSVFLCTHWEGTELPKTVQRALARKERWDDSMYLARIVFCEMVKGQEEYETGFGIGAQVGDGDDRVIILHHDRTVTFNGKKYTFEEYVALGADDLHWQ